MAQSQHASTKKNLTKKPQNQNFLKESIVPLYDTWLCRYLPSEIATEEKSAEYFASVADGELLPVSSGVEVKRWV